MYAIEFETDIKGEFIRLPRFEQLKDRHVKVIILTKEVVEEGAAQQEDTSATRRKPAQVPPIQFKGDVFDTASGSDWDLP
ncbi:hypothetical protein A3Q32_19260 [Alcanivorax sp. KX64203]|nr:hypothetical protein A3Q32_19260 [Alcanivorax sp. KX64203]